MEREKAYVIFDCKKGDLFFDGIDVTADRKTAIRIFHDTWSALSNYDKKQRDYFELYYAYTDGQYDAIETAELIDKIV